jgi:hypothetical protein
MSESVRTAAFDLGAEPTAIRRGKLFQCGYYADKQFALTPGEAAAAVAAFRPVPNDLEHTPTILDGKLGTLRSVAASEDGSELFGEVEIPRWLHEAIGDAPIKASLLWDRETKRIVGNALVIEPRIADAALLSAFSAAHPMAVAPGDTAHTHTIDTLGAFSPPVEPAVEETTDPVSVLATIKALLWGRDPKPSAANAPPIETQSPETAEEETVPETNGTTTATADFAASEEYRAMQAQIAALTARDTERAARESARDAEVTRERAEAWADAEIAAFRALPHERDALVAAFSEAAIDDRTAPRTVRFSADGAEVEGTRLDALRARQAARGQHLLTREQLALTPDQLKSAGVIFAQRPSEGDETMTTERHDELIRLSGFSVAKAN